MTCQKCVDAIKSALSKLDGINDFQISLETGSVIIDTTLPHSTIHETIESTGRKAVLKGYGGRFFKSFHCKFLVCAIL